MTISTFIGIFLLSRELDSIEFNTFMRARDANQNTSNVIVKTDSSGDVASA